eukprot:scaffold542499_cov59-Attheya_sp.AAC.3
METVSSILKFQLEKVGLGEENSCIICSLASALYEFGDVNASKKGERALKYQATLWKSGKCDILEQYTETYQFYAIFRTHWVPPIIV